MTTWSATSGHLQVGVDYSFSTPTHSSTSVTVTISYSIRTDPGQSWAFDDDEDMDLGGVLGGTPNYNFHNGLSGQGTVMHLATYTASVPIDYGSSPTFQIYGAIFGMYNGGNPTISLFVSPPARPAAVPGAPTLSAFTAVTDTSASAHWSTPSDEGSALTKYDIQWATDAGFTAIIRDVIAGWGTNNTTSTLTRDTTYHVRVRAKNGVGWGDWSTASTVTTDATVPSAPTGLGASGLTATGATLGWSAPSDNGGQTLTNYQLQVATNSSFSAIVHDTTAAWATSKTYSDLTRSTTYYARVRAQNATGWSPWSTSTSFGTLATGPDAPPAPTVSGVTPIGANFAWSVPASGGSAITGYTLQISSHSDFSAAVLTGTYGASTTSAPSPGSLVPGTVYYARVRATNATGDGAWSPNATFTTLPGIYIGNGTAWVSALSWIGDGSNWQHAIVKVGDGTTWH